MNDSNKIVFESYPRITKKFRKKIIDVLTKSNCEKEYSHRIKGRWENQYLDIDLVPDIKTIFSYACQMGKDIINKSLVIPYKQLGFPTNEFWFNIAYPGDETGWHDHKENAILSGVYYIKIPRLSGDIKFRRNINNNSWKEWKIKSKAGKMILFHSGLEHCVEKNNSSNKRISLAFNLYTLPIKLYESPESYSSNKFYS